MEIELLFRLLGGTLEDLGDGMVITDSSTGPSLYFSNDLGTVHFSLCIYPNPHRLHGMLNVIGLKDCEPTRTVLVQWYWQACQDSAKSCIA